MPRRYAFVCDACGLTVDKSDRVAPFCLRGHGEMRRDWRAEAVNVIPPKP